MIEKLTSKIDYLKPWKTIPALIEAWKKAKEKKDVGFFEKIGIFWKSFQKEMQEVDKKKAEVTQETTAAVAKTADATIKDAKDAVALPDSVSKDDRDLFDEVLAMGVASLKGLDDETEAKAHSGLAKIDKAAKGET